MQYKKVTLFLPKVLERIRVSAMARQELFQGDRFSAGKQFITKKAIAVYKVAIAFYKSITEFWNVLIVERNIKIAD